MDISDLRKRIDEIDRKLVELVNERARIAQEIGRLKRDRQMPVYEPEREKRIFENICQLNHGPLQDRELLQVYERLIDVMRKVQQGDVAPERRGDAAAAQGGTTELESELND
jgi:chorismate mutase